MKLFNQLNPFRHIASIGFAAVCMLLIPTESMAKLKVTAASATRTMTKSANGKSAKKGDYIYCEGYKTWITADANGNTQVYVNDDGGDFSKDSKYLVEEDQNGKAPNWQNITIFGGKGDGSCASVNIKMDDGCVKNIALADDVSNCFVSGTSKLEVTGGTMYGVIVGGNKEKSGPAEVYLSNARITGTFGIDVEDRESQTTLFVNTDCDFYANSARPSLDKLRELKGAIVPYPNAHDSLFISGAAVVPAKTTVNCAKVHNEATSISFGANSLLKIQYCDGWSCEGAGLAVSNYSSNVSIPSHGTKYITKRATCTSVGTQRTVCPTCNHYIGTAVRLRAKGHTPVEYETIEATCTTKGYSGGTYCKSCGAHLSDRTVTPASGHAWGVNKIDVKLCNRQTVQARICSVCSAVEISRNTHSNNNLILVTKSKVTKLNGGSVSSTSLTTFNKMVIDRIRDQFCLEKTCFHSGLAFVMCTECTFLETYEIPAGHDAQHVYKTFPTCEEEGIKEHWHCTACNKNFNSSALTQELEDIYIEPTGHQYGVAASRTGDNLKTAGSCGVAPTYWQVCANGCGTVSNRYVYYGAKADHQYKIESVDVVDHQEVPFDGILTIGCDNCTAKWPYFNFAMRNKVGNRLYEDEEDEVGTFDGYWSKSQLTKVKTLPTCNQVGEGEYTVTVNFHGQTLSATYDNFIFPHEDLHNYDENGVCHENHYVRYYNEYREWYEKTNYGQIVYDCDRNGDLIPDETVYSTKGYIAVPGSVESTTKDPEDDVTKLRYLDFEVTNVANMSEFLNAVAAQQGEFYANYYGDDLEIDVTNSASMAAWNKLKSGNMKGGMDVPNAVYLNDQTEYTATVGVSVPASSALYYKRTFANADVWESLYAPMSFDVETHSDVCEFADIYSFGQLFDTNGDGVLDNQDDTWLIVDMMTSGVTAGNYPYLIKAKSAGTIELKANGGILYKTKNTKNSCSTAGATYTFCGTNVNADLSSANTNFMMDAQGKLSVTENQTITPQRWHVQIAGKSNSAEYRQAMANGIRVMVMGEDISEETAIRLLQGETVEVNLDGQHYTLDGRKATNTPSGIQVVNGHKIISK